MEPVPRDFSHGTDHTAEWFPVLAPGASVGEKGSRGAVQQARGATRVVRWVLLHLSDADKLELRTLNVGPHGVLGCVCSEVCLQGSLQHASPSSGIQTAVLLLAGSEAVSIHGEWLALQWYFSKPRSGCESTYQSGGLSLKRQVTICQDSSSSGGGRFGLP